jgi:hypothetical protein
MSAIDLLLLPLLLDRLPQNEYACITYCTLRIRSSLTSYPRKSFSGDGILGLVDGASFNLHRRAS